MHFHKHDSIQVNEHPNVYQSMEEKSDFQNNKIQTVTSAVTSTGKAHFPDPLRWDRKQALSVGSYRIDRNNGKKEFFQISVEDSHWNTSGSSLIMQTWDVTWTCWGTQITVNTTEFWINCGLELPSRAAHCRLHYNKLHMPYERAWCAAD